MNPLLERLIYECMSEDNQLGAQILRRAWLHSFGIHVGRSVLFDLWRALG
jgi:flagellar biosynthesis regulator FlaF